MKNKRAACLTLALCVLLSVCTLAGCAAKEENMTSDDAVHGDVTGGGISSGDATAAGRMTVGKILSAYPRDSFYLATKFPGYDLANIDKVEEIFEAQLKKCGVDHFDFYLFHNVCEMNIDAYLDESHGIFSYLKKQKENGRIRHLGFSAHGSYAVIERFLEKYGRDMEFCQLQINYVDWTFQNAKNKVELLKKYNIPVWVMEPLRGGKLARLSAEEEAKLKALRPDEGIPAWAFRFLLGCPMSKSSFRACPILRRSRTISIPLRRISR